MLVVMSAFLSIFGGYLAGTLSGTLTPTEFIYGLRFEFVEYNVTFALIKSIAFALVVAAISSYKGFFTEGGALEVGRASTSAVTNSCIGVLTADFLLTKLLI